MRHGIKLRKLNRTSSHRLAMLRNLASSLIMHEQIKTTLPKAKTLRPFLEKFITYSKNTSDLLISRRYLLSKLNNDKEAVDKIINVLKARYENRNGGYLRIIKCGFRHGDDAPVAIIEFVDRDVSAKGYVANS